MNQYSFRNLQLNLPNAGFWLTIFLLFWLFSAIGLGWLVKSFFILMSLILAAPVIAYYGFRWWLGRNLVEDSCPVCNAKTAALNGMQLRCPSCSEPLMVEKGQFRRLTPPGTVDVEAIDVSVKQLED